jgi:hypothetical protein
MLKIIPFIIFLLPTTPAEVVINEHHWTAAAQIEKFVESEESQAFRTLCYKMGVNKNTKIDGEWVDDDTKEEEGKGKEIEANFYFRKIDPFHGLRDYDQRIIRYHYLYRIEIKDPKTNRKWIINVSKKNWLALNKGDKIMAAINSFGGIVDLKRVGD